jgi:hypothetical protein
MKALNFLGLIVFMISTGVEPVLASQVDEAGTSRASVEDVREVRLSDLGMKLNPQLGVSSFEYSGSAKTSTKQKLSGGATVEFGGDVRKLETGLLVVQSADSSYMTLPMMAKLRVMNMKAQNWYGKFGFAPAFEMSNNKRTNNIDILGTIGAGGRLYMNKKTDFIIEATFNRGLIEAVRSASDNNYNQGFLVLAGVSLAI